ncbi:MAG TPA: NACHT domain-containing protein [Allocoleopsis sp.]
MPQFQSRHRNVAVLTQQGFQKLQCSIAQLDSWNFITQTCSLEALSERTGLSPQTLSKVHTRQTNVDLRTLVRYFTAFELTLEPSDYLTPPPADKKLEAAPASSSNSIPASPIPASSPMVSWGMAPDVSVFYGRSTELDTLHDWVLQQHCRLVALVGMGGIGKTWLATRLAEQLQGKFQAVIWCSLKSLSQLSHSSYSFSDFITDLLQHLAPAFKPPIPETTHVKIRCLLDCLHQTRCLLVLDSVESVLPKYCPSSASENNDAIANPHYEDEYALLLCSLSQGRHQSCVVLTSREEPKSIQRLSGNNLSIRAFHLQGLQQAEAQQIFEAKGIFQGTLDEWSQLVTYYDGNPFFLETAATTIQHLFAGNVAAFLDQNTLIFDEIKETLDQQLDDLPHLEQTIVKVLAKQKTSIRFAELRSHIPCTTSTAALLAALQFLIARSLLERSSEHLSLPQLLRDYIKERYAKDATGCTMRHSETTSVWTNRVNQTGSDRHRGQRDRVSGG